MYLLFPVAYPIAKLLDRLLGASHGLVFNRAGLKTLIMLHEGLHLSPTESLNREDVTVASSALGMKEVPISAIMTPMLKVFSLGFDTCLNDMTRYNILKSGHSVIPVHVQDQPTRFMGVLPVKSLVALNFEEEVTVGQLALDTLPVVRCDASCQELFHIFRDRKVDLALVTERGTIHGEPMGIVSARDVMFELTGGPVAYKEAERDLS
jgi:metal transporter CNNM